MEFLHVLSLLLMLLECGIALLPSVHSVEEELLVPARAKRDTDIEFPLNISFTVNPYDAGTCYGGTSAGLGSTDLRLEYRNNASDFQWVEIAKNIPIGGDFSTAVNIPGSGCVVVRLVQEEHGGGDCNCWELSILALNFTDITSLCDDSASVPRSVEWSYIEGIYDTCDVPPIPVPRTKPFNTTCSQSLPHINVTFQLIFPSPDPIEWIDEGVEFSLQLGNERGWIPITLLTRMYNTGRGRILIGTDDAETGNLLIRGYLPEFKNATSESNTVTFCDFEDSVDSVQFRWLQTCRFLSAGTPRDSWTLWNVLITHQDGINEPFVLFDGSNSSSWSPRNIRNGDSSLIFGQNNEQNTTLTITVSRSVNTNPLLIIPSMDDNMTTTTLPRAMTTVTMTTTTLPRAMTTVTMTTTALPVGSYIAQRLAALREATESVQTAIMENPRLLRITTLPPAEALDELAAAAGVSGDDDDERVVIYLLGYILNQTTSETSLPINDFICVGNSIIENSQNNEANSDNVVGSSLLAIMDDYALNHLEQEGSFVLGNIALETRQLTTDSAGQEDLITAIDSSDFPSFSQLRMSIEIPIDLVGMFSNMSGMGSNGVRLGSFLYANVTGLFPSSLPGENGTSELASGIVSTALQCGTGKCPTDDLQLDTPVRITIEHSDTVKRKLGESDSTFESEIQCMFLEILTDDDSILSAGQWSARGCSRSESLSNTSVTVCECNHLTHFAILLSVAPHNLSDAVELSLEVIGYVGVSVSLVAMGLTIFTFVAFKSLHNMRNYIHINLCISLGIAQLIFVAGVDQSGSDHVPIHCQVIAVLLHYFFLVSFMWMLMEGVVLYIILIKVFVANTKRYVLAFTIASYGIPLLYLGLLTLPLGFALPTQPNYGYNTACFLNTENSFIWAFIAPVIVIILINVGFFIIAAIAMWRHNRRQTSGKISKERFRSWLKILVFLVVVMGLTWILGVLIVEVKELVPLAYIYTIMVAFQGLFIFLIFVVYPKDVREVYVKLWNKKLNTFYTENVTKESTLLKSDQTSTMAAITKKKVTDTEIASKKNQFELGVSDSVVVVNQNH